MSIVLRLRDHVVVPFCDYRSLLKNTQCRQSLVGSALQVRGSYFRLYFWASSINGAVSQCTYSAAALPVVQRSDDFQASSFLGALVKAGKFVFFRAVVWTAVSPTQPPSAASHCIPCLMFSRSRWTESLLTDLGTKVTAVPHSHPHRPCECHQNIWCHPYLSTITKIKAIYQI